MQNTKVTIKDVAKAAGVTNGTVDRVLHNRGEVAHETKAKVMSVVERLGYKPNVYASMLARNKAHSIAVLMPSFSKGDFWELVHNGLALSEEYAGRFSVSVVVYYYDQYDVESFRSQCRQVLEDGHSGVILAPMFLDDTLSFSALLTENNIPYVMLNTSAGTDGHLAYYGLAMYESGRCCADILMSMSDEEQRDKVYMVQIERDSKGLSDPSSDRRKGFRDYLSHYYPDTEVVTVLVNPNSPRQTFDVLSGAFEGLSGRLNIVTMNSRIFLVADYLRSRNMSGMNVVGCDVLKRNIDALREGYVRVLLGQHSDRQAAGAVMTLTDYLALGRKPKVRDNYMSIDILTKYNCKFYDCLENPIG